jgi:hypothetical protein
MRPHYVIGIQSSILLTLTFGDTSVPNTGGSTDHSRRSGQYVTKVTLESHEIAKVILLL